MKPAIKRIALIGPESTGKTTLCRELAVHFHTHWVPEFARAYIGSIGRTYNLQDIEYCAREQLKAEEKETEHAARLLFCDTELIIARVWCEDVFKKVPAWLEEKILTHRYDLYLLAYPDLPFVEDPVRENPHRRTFFFDWYKRELEERNFLYEVIAGEGKQRFLNALGAIQKHFPGL